MHPFRFSTLYGSKWVATLPLLSKTKLNFVFQYPLRVEVGCNAKEGIISGVDPEFQYPLRVEVGCNPTQIEIIMARLGFQYPLRVEVGCNWRVAPASAAASRCFSTLYGSKWVATSSSRHRRGISMSFSTLYGSKWVATRAPPRRWRRKLKFQYPLRVEVGCNDCGSYRNFCAEHVSVPSTGRSGLQRRRAASCKNRFQCFSTLYGSKWVATTSIDFSRECPTCFSTLYGSKWVATPLPYVFVRFSPGFSTLYGSKWVATQHARLARHNFHVSVPSTGRSGLQRGNGMQGALRVCSFSTLYGSKWVATLTVSWVY